VAEVECKYPAFLPWGTATNLLIFLNRAVWAVVSLSPSHEFLD